MRVAYDATPLLDARTGVGAFVAEVLDRLARAEGVDVVAWALTRKYLPELRARVPAGVTVIDRPLPARTSKLQWRHRDRPYIERWTGPVDVVHGGNFLVPPARHAVELMTVHDLTCIHHPEWCDANTARYPILIRRALARGAHVHAVSATVAGEVADAFDLDPARIHVVPNGVDAIPPGLPAAGVRLAGGAPYVLALGTIEPRKNLAALVRAMELVWARTPDVRLVLAGRDGWGTADLDEAIARSSRPTAILRLGPVDAAGRADLLAGAAVLAYPSSYEGFGLPPLEAMAAGVPVVAADLPVLREVLGDAAVLTPPTPEGLAEGLVAVLADGTGRAARVAAGRTRAAGYSWDATAEGIVALYRELVAAGPG